jgi:epsilon-lactone hydrolase
MQFAAYQAVATGETWSAVHAITPQDRIVMDQMRAMIEPNKGKLRGVAARVPFDAIMGRVVAPDGVNFRHDTIGAIGGWWCEPTEALPGAVTLHAHGGWFNWGSAEAFRHLIGHIARSANANAFLPETTASRPKIPSPLPWTTSTRIPL